MNKRLLVVLAFAFVISAAATLLLYRLINARLAATPAVAVGKLLVAATNLQVGTLISDADIKEVDWSGNVPPLALRTKESIVGRGVVANIYDGEPILDTRLAAKGAGAGLAATIPVGMRAVAVRVNDVVGVAGFVTPGMHVDILILGTSPAMPGNLGTLAKTLLQNVAVLSAGQQIQKDAEGKPVTVPVINLLVTPEQAEILSLASNDARIQLILRNPLDTKDSKTPGTAMSRLFTGQFGPLPVPGAGSRPRRTATVTSVAVSSPAANRNKAEPPPILVEVITGGAKAEIRFQSKSEEKPR
jgi:pilus assembly protein CpaB